MFVDFVQNCLIESVKTGLVISKSFNFLETRTERNKIPSRANSRLKKKARTLLQPLIPDNTILAKMLSEVERKRNWKKKRKKIKNGTNRPLAEYRVNIQPSLSINIV